MRTPRRIFEIHRATNGAWYWACRCPKNNKTIYYAYGYNRWRNAAWAIFDYTRPDELDEVWLCRYNARKRKYEEVRLTKRPR